MNRIKNICVLSMFSFFIMACGNNAGHDNDTNASNEHAGHLMPPANAGYCDSVNSGLISPDTMKGSPLRTAMATVNGTHVHIEYGSPGVKGRVIWGGLVAYDKVWVTGAHNATTIQFSQPVIVGDKTIPKGTYGLFTIPGKDNWQVIINSRYEQHLADDYTDKEDLVRISTPPGPAGMTQRLTYTVRPAAKDGGEISIRWEKLEIIVPFKTLQK